jgi:hypothetical protein
MGEQHGKGYLYLKMVSNNILSHNTEFENVHKITRSSGKN